jgi:hypothetical protein
VKVRLGVGNRKDVEDRRRVLNRIGKKVRKASCTVLVECKYISSRGIVFSKSDF